MATRDRIDQSALDEFGPALVADRLEQRALESVRLLVLGVGEGVAEACVGCVVVLDAMLRFSLPRSRYPRKSLLTYYLWVYMFW
ncbi:MULTISPECIES: hypothetical protein [unclassified Microbacterium]|uniref:hypothetical protein n=1 Tax=unclassified Microbacterium TaxID=2609290 RepID=UPI001FCE6EFC|nr:MULTISPECIES: hypothetical protein [unclassified Microbacterium]